MLHGIRVSASGQTDDVARVALVVVLASVLAAIVALVVDHRRRSRRAPFVTSRRSSPPSPPVALASGEGGGEEGARTGLVIDAALFATLYPWASILARRFGASRADADDIAQEAFIRLSKIAPAFTFPPDVPPLVLVRQWLARAISIVCASRRRDALRDPLALLHPGARVEDPAADESEAPTFETGEDPTDEIDARQDLAGILSRFYEATRERPELWRAWYAHEVEGAPAPEIARREGVPPNTVYSRIFKARAALAAMLEREDAAARFALGRDATKGRK